MSNQDIELIRQELELTRNMYSRAVEIGKPRDEETVIELAELIEVYQNVLSIHGVSTLSV